MTLEISIPSITKDDFNKLCIGAILFQDEEFKELSAEEKKKRGWDDYVSSFHEAFTIWNGVSGMEQNQVQTFYNVGLKALESINLDRDVAKSFVDGNSSFNESAPKIKHLDEFLNEAGFEGAQFLSLKILVSATLMVQGLISAEESSSRDEARDRFFSFVPEMNGMFFSLKLRDIREGYKDKTSFEDYQQLDSILENFDWDNSKEIKVFYSIIFLILHFIIK